MATIGEMIVKLLADNSNFNASMDEAAAKVTASNDAMAASMASSMQSFRDFDAITKQSVQSTEGLAQAQAALQAVQQTGAFTSEELAAKEALIADAMKKVGSETQEASGIVSMFTRNSRTMYSTSALITDAMTGQYSRMRREVAALANETGAFAKAFQIMVGPIGLAVAAVGGFAFAAIEGAENASKLDDALAATGGALGVTNSQITNIRDGLIDADTTIGEATTLVSKLALSGQFLGNSLGDAARAAQGMAELTGESMDRAATAVEDLAKDPVKALQKLNDQFHFLTVPEAQEIANLLKIGDEAGAAAAAVRDLANAEGQRIQKSQQAQGYIGSWWSSFKGGLHSMESAAESWGAPKTLEQQLGDVQEEIEKTANMYQATLGFKGGEHVENSGLMDRSAQDQINALLAKREALMKQVADESAKAAQAAKDTAATTKQTNDIIAAAGKGSKGGHGSDMSALEEQFKEQEAARHASYDQMRIDGADYWNAEATNAKNSAAVQAAAWQKYVQIRNQLDSESLRESESAAHARTESERATATKLAQLYKGETDSFKQEVQKQYEADQQALRQRIADAQEAARASIEAAQQEYDQTADKLRSMLQLHEITAEQEVEGNRRAEQKKYEDDLAALENDLALVREKPEAVARVKAEIKKLEQQHNLAMQKLDEQAALAFQKTWEGRLKPVSNAFDQMINGMMQGTQTFRQAMDNMLQNVAASFIKHSIDMTVRHIADSLARTDATAAAAANQVAITKAAAGQTKAVEAQTGQSQIMSAAATGAAKAYQAVVGIPYVGPILAPVAAAVAFAGIEAFTSDLASAAGGWERVPADGMLTELHRDEMVLPKHVADPMRNMARNGGGNAGGAIHIHATDAASFKDFLRRNPGILAGGMRHAAARGHF